MRTMVCYFDYKGKYLERKKSDYMNYKEGDKIIHKEIKYKVMSILYDEDEGYKNINAYCTFSSKDKDKIIKEAS